MHVIPRYVNTNILHRQVSVSVHCVFFFRFFFPLFFVRSLSLFSSLFLFCSPCPVASIRVVSLSLSLSLSRGENITWIDAGDQNEHPHPSPQPIFSRGRRRNEPPCTRIISASSRYHNHCGTTIEETVVLFDRFSQRHRTQTVRFDFIFTYFFSFFPRFSLFFFHSCNLFIYLYRSSLFLFSSFPPPPPPFLSLYISSFLISHYFFFLFFCFLLKGCQ